MRFQSHKTGGYQVFAVTGTNTVSFGIDFSGADTKGLLGFAVERFDPVEDERYFMYGFKVFGSMLQSPDDKTAVSTFEHPVQSFVWDDFTAKAGRKYKYWFHPLKGTPKNIDRRGKPIAITIRTEPLFSKHPHDVFFNRGVAGSQAYARRFGNITPSNPKLTDKERQDRLAWLSRDLDEALLKFIASASKGDALLCCFYEFRCKRVADALREAIDRGVEVRIIVDAKVNGSAGKPSFPREDNLEMLKKARIPKSSTVLREAKPNEIAHNKFMVLLKGASRAPAEVWTGSTNLSEGGIHGQTNVGHWVRSKAVAARFKAYWELLSTDPGPKKSDPAAKKKNLELRTAVEQLVATPVALDEIDEGITPIFSPRTGSEVLELYATLVDDAKALSCITLAFGISAVFKAALKDNTPKSHLAFVLLEKRDKPNKRSKKAFVGLSAKNNVYQAWGSFLRTPLYKWTRETNAGALKINSHVSYVHSKFLLRDPLGDDPLVVTGSANFSDASTNDNDENMLVIRGNQRVADIYFTEFNRLFNHYYFRSVQEAMSSVPAAAKKEGDEASLFLAEDDSWIKKYKSGSLKRKRVVMFTKMQGCKQG